MKLGANIHQVGGHCCKGFQGQRQIAKVVLTAEWSVHTF